MTQATTDEPQEAGSSFSLKHLLFCALILGCITFGADDLNTSSWNTNNISILWPSTGLLIGMILCLPRRQWPIYIAAGFCIDLVANILPPLNEPFPLCAYLALCNVIEVSLAAWLLRSTLSPSRYMAQPRQLVSLLAYGVVVAPAVASLFSAVVTFFYGGKLLFQAFADWYTGDALGIAIVTPLYVALQGRAPFSRRKWDEIASLFACLLAVSILVFWQTSLPLLFMILPVLLLLEVRLGMAGAAMGLLAVSVIGGYLTARGHGPIGLTHLKTLSARTLVLQLFTMVCMLVVYIAEVVRAERNRFELGVRASEQRFRLLAEESHDIITLSNLKGEIQYVSPAVKSLLGFEPGEWLPVDRAQAVHPDDQAGLDRLYAECLAGKPNNILDFRIRRKSGDYLWLEANLVLHRDPDTSAPAGFINVVRDISVRKAVEENLNKALNVAESQASVDPLTGIPNRRSLDAYLETEWRRASRSRSAISALMIDVDHFKRYNDRYGHLCGDRCLKEVATAIAACLHRHSDFAARYGGEEFVVILPDTDIVGAQIIADQIRCAVEQQQIPHEDNSHRVVTISAGCAAQTPERGLHCARLLESADAALYQAKSDGRNCVRLAREEDVVSLGPG
jgi:diguanylate cyclase (GGDEF)-like protein/PAS domain S-box-containing protein